MLRYGNSIDADMKSFDTIFKWVYQRNDFGH
jgi:hypothetical protein